MATPDVLHRPAGVNQHQPKHRRRQRVINSCYECRKRKMRCSKTFPCYNCSRFDRHCVFIAAQNPDMRAPTTHSTSDTSATQSHTSDDDDARLYFPLAYTAGASPFVGDGQTPNPDTEQMYDSLYDADAEDDLMDLGLQIGRLCISERFVNKLPGSGSDSIMFKYLNSIQNLTLMQDWRALQTRFWGTCECPIYFTHHSIPAYLILVNVYTTIPTFTFPDTSPFMLIFHPKEHRVNLR